jgi:FkbH-like protein
MKLAEALRIVQDNSSAESEKFVVFLACGIAPLHLSTFLAAYLKQRLPKRAVEISSGLYGDLPGNLQQLQHADTHAGAIAIEWSDLDPRLGLRRLGGWGPAVLPDIQAGVSQRLSQLLQLLSAAAQSTPLAVSLPTIPLPPISYQPREQFGVDNLLLEKALCDFATQAARIPRLKIINRQWLDTISPVSERLDLKSELTTGFPYRTAHAANLARLFAGLIQPQAPKKGLITDLDGTLWRGLIGEEGVTGISWDLDHGSHVHALYQQLLNALSESGVLLGVASRNDPELVNAALDREDLIVSKDQFFPLEVSWNSKSKSVARILEAWNIDADAVVFVDDSPFELAEVQSAHPGIQCLHFPNDATAEYDLLHQLRGLFGKPEILPEDAIRAGSIRRAVEFKDDTSSDSARPPGEFLSQIDAELTLTQVTPNDLRAFELVNKTNQFNLNGRRLSEVEFQSALKKPGAVSLLVCYKDKYGPLGRIAVLLGEVDASVLKIDTWVMSCRAFSRHIEYRCLEYLFEHLHVSEIVFDFQPTDRNSALRDFLSKLIDADLTPSPGIRRDSFMDRKPALSHRINEASYV